VLSRVAENVYWLARYLERAENTARLVNVNAKLLLDLPPEYRPGWLALIDITGSRELFDACEKRAEEREIVHFLIADLDNPGSILSSVRSARENARVLPDVLPNEVWEHMNELFMEIKEKLPAALSKRTRFHFLQRIIRGMQTLTGELEGTMSRNDAFTLLMLGRNLERADMTSRIIDVRSAQLLPADAPEFGPFETIQWLNLLKSLSGYQMYRLSQRTRVSRSAVLEFVLRDLQFPRACQFCLKEVELSRYCDAGDSRPGWSARAHRSIAVAHHRCARGYRADLFSAARRCQRPESGAVFQRSAAEDAAVL
jgi:uncharacterized alpha-E superfamily protein